MFIAVTVGAASQARDNAGPISACKALAGFRMGMTAGHCVTAATMHEPGQVPGVLQSISRLSVDVGKGPIRRPIVVRFWVQSRRLKRNLVEIRGWRGRRSDASIFIQQPPEPRDMFRAGAAAATEDGRAHLPPAPSMGSVALRVEITPKRQGG